MKKNTYKTYTFGTRTVFIFKTGSFNTNNKLHTYHKHYMAWSVSQFGVKPKCGHKRTRMIDRACKASAAKCEIATLC